MSNVEGIILYLNTVAILILGIAGIIHFVKGHGE